MRWTGIFPVDSVTILSKTVPRGFLRPWYSKRGHIVVDTLLPMMFLGLHKLGNICGVPDTKFVSARNVVRGSKRGNICVSNNVSATKCPCLPGPLRNDPKVLNLRSHSIYLAVHSPSSWKTLRHLYIIIASIFIITTRS